MCATMERYARDGFVLCGCPSDFALVELGGQLPSRIGGSGKVGDTQI